MLIFLFSASKPKCSLRIGVGMLGRSSSSLYIPGRFLKYKKIIYELGTDRYFSGRGWGDEFFFFANNLFPSFMQLQTVYYDLSRVQVIYFSV